MKAASLRAEYDLDDSNPGRRFFYLKAATGWPIPSIYLTRIDLYARDKRVLGLYLAKFSELAW